MQFESTSSIPGATASTEGPRLSHGSLAEALLPLLNGPLLAGEVLTSWRSALALAIDAPEGNRVLSVLTPQASGVPHGLRVTDSADDRPFDRFTAGDAVFVGAGSVQLHGWRIRPTQIYATAVPVIRTDRTRLQFCADRLADHSIGVDLRSVTALRRAIAEQDAGELRTRASALVGMGAGTTPGGDDVLAGTVVGLRAAGRSALVQQITVAISGRLTEHTTAYSADLLRLATAGHAGTEALRLLRLLDERAPAGEPDELGRALDRLLAVGHTSGADLATGLLIGLACPATSGELWHRRGRARIQSYSSE